MAIAPWPAFLAVALLLLPPGARVFAAEAESDMVDASVMKAAKWVPPPGSVRVSSLLDGGRSATPFSSSIFDTSDDFLVSRHTFDSPLGTCFSRGWTAQDRTNLIFSHVSTSFVVNDSPPLANGYVISMGTKALWVGADATSAPEEVATWVQDHGYGNDWSQRIISPSFSTASYPNAILTFNGSIGLRSTGGVTTTINPTSEFLAVQGLNSNGSWVSLTARFSTATLASFTAPRITGLGLFRCEVRTGEDGNQSLGLVSNTQLRIVVQTSSSESNEDGFQSPGAGAAVVDSLRLRDATTDASIVADVDFEDGSTGGWTLAAQNGYFGPNVVPVGYVRDVPSATSQAGVVSGFDFNDPTCVWQFTATNGYAAPGQFTYLTSPWFPAFQSDSGFVVVMTSKLPLSTSVERRFIQPFMRGKNVGDAGPRLIARPSFILFGGGATTDASAPLTSVTSRYPQDFTIFTPLVSQFTDSVQFVLRSLDRPEPVLPLLGRTPTRLPFIDDIEIYLINVDRDHDGVPDAVDGCPTVSAAGQDANGDGCTDQGATLRHVESWSESRPLHVAISANGDPRIADGSDLTEVQAGFQAWSGVPGSSLSIQFDAPTVAHDSSPLDGVNLITFEDDHFSFPPDVVAVTPTLSFTTRGSYLDEPALPGEIVDADMIFNPAFTFSTPTHNGGPGSFDLRSVVTHEAGHFLGLSHSGTLDATMFFVLQPRQDAASLEDDDRAAIAAAYPDPSLFTDFGAITGHVVRGGTVQPVPGALVTAVRLGAGNALEDSTASDYTDEDGAYALRRLPPGSYAVRITPLDGEVGGFPLTPAYISQRVQAEAVADFDAEWWDAAEGAADPPNAFEPIAVAAGTTVPGIDVVTNIDATGPAVASVTPADNAVDVHVDQAIVVDFDERIDSSSLQGNLLLHVAGAGHPSLGGSGELQLNGRRFLFAPSPTLEFGTTYELEVTSGITDRAGNTLPTPVTTRFTTESRPTVAITDLQPRSAPEGALITILGAGFDATAANQVSFTCPSCAPVVVAGTSVTPSTIVVQVPAGATTGPIQVTVGAEMSNLLTLTVLPPGNQVAPSLNGRFDLPSGFSPTDVAIAPDGLTLYAVGPGGFATINLDPGLPDLRVVRVETLGACNHLALTPDGSLAYVTRRDLGDVIAVDADPRSGRFRQPRATIPAGESGSPDGIAIAPSGQRAYVTDPFGSLIYEIDTDVRSLTRNQVRRELQDPDHALTGGVAVAPGSGTVYFTTSNAGSRSFDLGTPTSSALNDEPSAGGVVVTPSGGEVLSLGGETSAGTVLFHRSSGVPAAGSFVLGGALRDIAVGPQGKSAFVVNAAYNRLQVVDVDALSPSYHTRVAEVATGQNPSAIAVSTDGARIVIAEEGSSSVALYGTGTQGQIVRVEPSIALPGDQVSIALSSGFDATGAKVDLGAGALLVSRVSSPSPSAVALRVPSLAQSDLGLTVVGSNGNRTLAAGFRVVDAIEGLTPRTTGFVLTSSGEQCAGTPTIGALEHLRCSDDGRMVAVARERACESFLDLHEISGRPGTGYGQRLAHVTLSATPITLADAAWTPDDRQVWVSIGTAEILVVDADPASSGFGSVASIGLAAGEIPRAIAADPMGRFMVVALANGDVVLRDPVAGGPIATISTGEDVATLAVAPDGRYAIVGAVGRASFVDLDGRTVAATTTDHSIGPADHVTSIAVTSNGKRAVGRFDNGSVGVWNLNPPDGAVGVELYFGNPLPGGVTLSQLVPAPDGDGVLSGCSSCDDLVKLEVTAAPPTVTTAAIGQRSLSLARTPDGRLLLVGQWDALGQSGDVRLFNLNDSRALTMVAGGSQAGSLGATLPTPVRVRLTDALARPQVGLVRFTLPSGQGALDGEGPVVYRLTDTNGEASVSWTLPGTSATETLDVEALGVGLAVTATADAVATDDQIVPQVVAFGPASGATDIHIGSAVFVRFNQRMNESSVASRISLTVGGALLGGSLDFVDEGRVAVFQPAQPMAFGSSCVLRMTAGAVDLDGQLTVGASTATFVTQTQPPLAIQSINPPAVEGGAPVVLAGQGFGLIPAQNIVSFNGVLATVTTASFTKLTVNVPNGATTGPVTVTVGGITSNPVQYIKPAPPTIGTLIDDVPAHPGIRDIAVTPDGQHAYITNPAENTVTVMTLNPPALLTTLSAGWQPQGIAILPDGASAYVANTRGNDVSVIDIDPTSPTYHRETRIVGVGDRPVDVAVSAAGDQVIVVGADDEGTVSFIDSGRHNGTYNQVIKKTSLGSGGQSVAISADGTRMFVVTVAGVLVELDVKPGSPTRNQVIKKTSLGSGGQSVAITADGTILLVLLTNGDLLVVDVTPGSATKNQVIKKTNLGSGGQSVAVTADGGTAYVTTGNRVIPLLIQTASSGSNMSLVSGPAVTLTVFPPIEVGVLPVGLAIEPNGERMFVANQGSGTVSVLSSFSVPPDTVVAEFHLEPSVYDIGVPGEATGWIELPSGLTAQQIAVSSVRFNDAVAPDASDVAFDDRDQDGLLELVVKFDRREMDAVVVLGENVPVTVAGSAGLRPFHGTGVIEVRPYSGPTAVPAREDLPRSPVLAMAGASPARGTLKLRFGLPEAADVRLEIYDVGGRRVRSLVGERRPAGWYSISWDGKAEGGGTAASGIYFVHMITGRARLHQRVVWLR